METQTQERAYQNGHTGQRQEEKKSPPMMFFADALGDAMNDAGAAHEALRTGKPRGPKTGFPKLDLELGGAFAPGPHVLLGNPGAGKTAFALQIAAECQFPVLFVTCEMAPAELLRRHAARVTDTFLGKFKTGELDPKVVEIRYKAALEAAPMMALLDGTKEAVSPRQILDSAQILKTHFDARSVLVVVDSVHSWAETAFDGPLGEYEILNKGIKSLRVIASILNAPVLYVSEKNRDGIKNGGGQSSGAGSRKIEYGAESVISLDRKQDDTDDGAGEVPITLKLAKNRHGTPGVKVDLKFNGALQRFREL